MGTKTAVATKYAGVSSEAVAKRTGRDWDEWFALLDARGGKTLDHKGIVALLEDQDISGWWQQMIAVGYEQARGKRIKHELPDGFQISRTRTLAAPVSEVFGAWQEMERRRRWLDDPGFKIRTATRNKCLRFTWVDGKTNVDVQFAAKGKDKCQVTVQQRKLPDAKAAEKMKRYWCEQLERLRRLLERRG